MADFGGRMRLTLSGVPLEIRGEVKVRPLGFEISKITNASGSVSRSLKPDAPEFDVKLESAPGLDLIGIVRGGPYAAQMVEEDTGILHTMANATFIGKYEEDRETGEVSGISLACGVDDYARIGA